MKRVTSKPKLLTISIKHNWVFLSLKTSFYTHSDSSNYISVIDGIIMGKNQPSSILKNKRVWHIKEWKFSFDQGIPLKY